jgi:hypothetical protein
VFGTENLWMNIFLFFPAEYDAENPKKTTKCEHHFHLACILEWMERSDTCPVCDKVCLNEQNFHLFCNWMEEYHV